MNNYQKCIKAVQKKIDTTELRGCTLKGARLSIADLEMVILYAQHYERGDYYSMFEPTPEIKKVLEGFGIEVPSRKEW